MGPAELAAEIKAYCEENANPTVVEKYAQHFKGGYDAYGLSLEQLEDIVMQIIDEGAGYKLIKQTCRVLVRSKKYEETSFAILLTKAFEKDFTAKSFDEIEFWFMFGIRNWAHTDVISAELIFPMLKLGLIPMSRMEEWKSASNKFQRRAVPLSLIKQMKADKDVKPYLEFLEPMMMDKAKEVQEAMGWFLREAWKTSKPAVEEFLLKWKDEAPKQIMELATEKMNASEKSVFKKTKPKAKEQELTSTS